MNLTTSPIQSAMPRIRAVQSQQKSVRFGVNACDTVSPRTIFLGETVEKHLSTLNISAAVLREELTKDPTVVTNSVYTIERLDSIINLLMEARKALKLAADVKAATQKVGYGTLP
jgi:hypothetical protein